MIQFFQGKSTDPQGLNFKLCLVLCSLLQCYTAALLPWGEPGAHATGKVYANTNQSAQAYFLKTSLKREFYLPWKLYLEAYEAKTKQISGFL